MNEHLQEEHEPVEASEQAAPTLYKLPLGAAEKRIPKARMAQDAGPLRHAADDAAFFERLELHGIRLNEAQVRAVRHDTGPMLTLAGAGSGKTSVLVCRTAYLLTVRKADPRSLLLMTFSTKAAAEMRERIARLPGVGEEAAGSVEARTFHSFFLYMLRRQGIREDVFSETRRQHILLKQMMRELGLQDTYQPETLLAVLSSYKMNLIPVADMPESTDAERETKAVLLRYEAWKQENGKIDFDDILLLAYKLLQERPQLLRSLQSRFRYIMVDEFQDTNFLQYELVKLLVAPHRNLMVVGDDDQTIYSFNGARSEFILKFEEAYPGVKVVTLDINYRSTSAIVGLGNAIIQHNKARRAKTLQATKQSEDVPRYMTPKSTDDEASKVLAFIQEEVAEGRRQYGDFAVLYRSASNNRAIMEQLLLQSVPFIEYGDGQLLYEHWIIKPVVDHLRLALYRRDFEAMAGVLPTLYISRDRGLKYIQEQDAIRAKKGPLIHLLSWPELKDFQKDKIKERLLLIKSLAAMKPADAIVHIRRKFYDGHMETVERQNATQHKEMLREMLDELEASAGRFDTLEAFLAFISDVMEKSEEHDNKKREEQGDRVALMTIHRSKGLEFPVVLLIGASEGSLPHSSSLDAERMKDTFTKLKSGNQKADEALEEERRLAYVAVTRAREQLIISSPAYYRGKKAAVSRFLLSAFGVTAPPKRESDERRSAYGVAGRGGWGEDRKAGGSWGEDRRTGAGYARREETAAGVRRQDGVAPSMSWQRAGAREPERAVLQKDGGAGRKITVPAWLCESPTCKAWTRIMTQKDEGAAAKACPLCKSPMKKGTREVPAN
ncbi:UvrD-helicase domain-containing protein [Paenibacillus aurantiacus]|uniref:DNA 3'-5' helicase n=1 Tax=Paenibacillus aurantiacus TaxID=1936118 RepID=A0ABV5KNE5_9BACL